MKRTLFFMLICIAALGFQACDDDNNGIFAIKIMKIGQGGQKAG